MTQTLAHRPTSLPFAYAPIIEDAEASRDLVIATLKSYQAQSDLLYAQTGFVRWFRNPLRLTVLDREVLRQGRSLRRIRLSQADGGAESITFTFHEDGTMEIANAGALPQEDLPRQKVSIDCAIEAIELYLLRALGSPQNIERLRAAQVPAYRVRS